MLEFGLISTIFYTYTNKRIVVLSKFCKETPYEKKLLPRGWRNWRGRVKLILVMTIQGWKHGLLKQHFSQKMFFCWAIIQHFEENITSLDTFEINIIHKMSIVFFILKVLRVVLDHFSFWLFDNSLWYDQIFLGNEKIYDTETLFLRVGKNNKNI